MTQNKQNGATEVSAYLVPQIASLELINDILTASGEGGGTNDPYIEGGSD